jgi:hypothetical protein
MLGADRRPVHSRLCIDNNTPQRAKIKNRFGFSQFPHSLITASAGSFMSNAATLAATQPDTSPAKDCRSLILADEVLPQYVLVCQDSRRSDRDNSANRC